MPENLNKQRILDYLKACYAGDIERAASYYDDEIDFIAYAPIDVFPSPRPEVRQGGDGRIARRIRAMYRPDRHTT